MKPGILHVIAAYLVIFISQFLMVVPLKAQKVFLSTKNEHIYSFIDEMAIQGHINVNIAIKPYTRKEIADHLLTVNKLRAELNKRQQSELAYFLNEFRFDYDTTRVTDHILKRPLDKINPFNNEVYPLNLFAYRDKNAQVVLNPILGIQYWNNENGSFYHRWNGLSAYTTLFDNLGIYINARDNLETVELSRPEYLTQRQGALYRSEGNEYLSLNTGITYNWKWGSLGLQYDEFQWGTSFSSSNILSGKAPPFTYINFNIKPLKWLELNYIHGWIYSKVVDSSRTYSYPGTLGYSEREVYYPKYIAANMITVKPFKRLAVSVGNSIIYSDVNVQPAYLIPVMIFRFSDTQLEGTSNNSGNNSQMYFDINYVPFNRVMIYTTLFVDEISFGRMWDPEKHSNYISWKAGMRWVNFANSNLTFTFEYTRTNPEVYRHVIPTTTFESSNFTLGHYLKDNAQEIYAAIEYKPLSRLISVLSYTNIKKGPDYQTIPNQSRWGLPFLSPVVLKSSSIDFKINYLLRNNVSAWFIYSYMNPEGDLSFLPEVYHGMTNTFSFGLCWGINY